MKCESINPTAGISKVAALFVYKKVPVFFSWVREDSVIESGRMLGIRIIQLKVAFSTT